MLGEPGIGKTALLDCAEGMTVVPALGVESEAAPAPLTAET